MMNSTSVNTNTTTYMLTGDIGGTNSRMGLYDISSEIPLAVKYYRNQDYIKEPQAGIFESKIIAPFLQHCWETVHGLEVIEKADIIACLAVAGPVADNRVRMSNLLNIEIDGNAIDRGMYCQDAYVQRIRLCKVINDFVAQGFGCLTLKPDEVRELTPGSHEMIVSCGPKVCVGAGTGLGQCFLTPDGSTGAYSCFPSEGGHVEFNPRSELENKMRTYLMGKFGYTHRLSIERVVSGRGLANVYEFLALEYPDRVDDTVHGEFLSAGDMQGKVVSDNAAEGTLCKQAMDIMIAAYGSEVGSTAIKFIPTGGLFVTGGLTPKNIKFIEGANSEFMKAYHDKGRVSYMLSNIPLFAVMVEDLGVRGAHKCCQVEFEKLHRDDEPLGAPAPGEVEPLDVAAATAAPFYGPEFLVVSTIAAVAAGVLLGRRK